MVIKETPVFMKQVDKLLDAESYRLLQLRLVQDPEAGALIRGTGGLRKIRWRGSGRGKRGGVRANYYEGEAARETRFDDPEVAAIREEYGLSQTKFAALLGISVRTLQNWEQGRRHPQGPAKVLLRVAAKHPRAVLDSVK